MNIEKDNVTETKIEGKSERCVEKGKPSFSALKEKVLRLSEGVKKDSDKAIVENASEPIYETIKRRKLFFVSDMDEEAEYLHEMSLQGYHFIKKKGMCYYFRQGEPINYYYHLGYYEKDKRDGVRYLDNYVAAGWEDVYHEKGEFDGIWHYFRVEMPTGEAQPNIFSDKVSRLELYNRLLSSWRSLLALDVICFIMGIFFYLFIVGHPSDLLGMFTMICTFLFVMSILIFIIYYRAYRKINHKRTELENF